MKARNKRIGILITLIGGSLWGLSGACGQFLFSEKEACSDWLVPIRLILAGLLLTIFYLVRQPSLSKEVWSHKKSAFMLICYGILGMMLCQYSYFRAIEYSNAGTATILQYLSPVLIMITMCVWEKRLPGIIDVIAVFLALAGIFLLATHGNVQQLVISGSADWRNRARLFAQTLAVSSCYRHSFPALPYRHRTARHCRFLFPLYAGCKADRSGKGKSLCLHRTGFRSTFFLLLAACTIHAPGHCRLFMYPLNPLSDYALWKA